MQVLRNATRRRNTKTVYASSSRLLHAQCAAKVVVDVSSAICGDDARFKYGAGFGYAPRLRRGGLRGGTRLPPKHCGFHSLPQRMCAYGGDVIYTDRQPARCRGRAFFTSPGSEANVGTYN